MKIIFIFDIKIKYKSKDLNILYILNLYNFIFINILLFSKKIF